MQGKTKHRDKIRKGYLTPAFLGAHKRAELLCKIFCWPFLLYSVQLPSVDLGLP